MPRSARLDAPGVIHHIIIRGIERTTIFRDDRDRDSFLERLGTLLEETRTACYAWALLGNHAHFLLRTGAVPISTLMRRLLTGYVVRFNLRYRRKGHLLQNRYKSIVCQEEVYFQELVRYIHLNPLRARAVPDFAALNEYSYCGHSAVTGHWERPWQDVKYVLKSFGKKLGKARKGYLAYVEAGVERGRRRDLVGGGLVRSLGGWAEVEKLKLRGEGHLKSDERILGGSDFVDSVLEQAKESFSRRCRLKRQGFTTDGILERVAEVYGMSLADILAKGRQPSRVRARSLFCFWAVRELGDSMTSLATRLEMSPAGISGAVQRGQAIVKEKGYRLIP